MIKQDLFFSEEDLLELALQSLISQHSTEIAQRVVIRYILSTTEIKNGKEVSDIMSKMLESKIVENLVKVGNAEAIFNEDGSIDYEWTAQGRKILNKMRNKK